MSEKVRIPFTFVVRKITVGPPEEAPSDGRAGPSPGLNDVSLPFDDLTLNVTPELEEAIEEARQAYPKKTEADAKEARRRAREAEEAKWEPKTIPAGASSLMADLYRNLRQPRGSGETTESACPDNGVTSSVNNQEGVSKPDASTSSNDDLSKVEDSSLHSLPSPPNVSQSLSRNSDASVSEDHLPVIDIEDDEELVGPTVSAAKNLYKNFNKNTER